MIQAVKIKTYKVGKAGGRGIHVGLPPVWIDDLNLKPGDRVDVYRDTEDRLIIMKAEISTQLKNAGES